MNLFLECECGCSLLRCEYTDGGELFSLCHYSMSYMNMQDNWFYRLKRIVEILWSIVMGKEFCFYEISLQSKEQVENFKKFVANIDSSKMMFDN